MVIILTIQINEFPKEDRLVDYAMESRHSEAEI